VEVAIGAESGHCEMGNPTETRKADSALWRVFSPPIMHGDGKAVRGRGGASSVADQTLAATGLPMGIAGV
jgi:hypothetical protein